MKNAVLAFLFFSVSFVYSQKLELAAALIPDSLKQNANAVVRLDQLDITISSQRAMILNKKRTVTVFNKSGESAIEALEFYDKRTNVRTIEATVYDAFGNEIKKIKRKDFRDQSASDGSTMFSDNRVLYLDYTATQYPFTIVYQSEVSTSNTAFIPRWYFLNRYFASLELGILKVVFPNNLGFKKKEFNFSGFAIQKKLDTTTQLSYEVKNLLAHKREDQSVSNEAIFPWVMMGLEVFNIEGVDGQAKTWKEFGQWYATKILYDTNELSEETVVKMQNLVGSEKDPIKKAKTIYQYLQDKSRYVSIQVGIGGWKPTLAKDVDRLGYGDCKALTNYTKALLNAVGVPSYNTLLYGSLQKKDIETDFVSMQGNHMILAIPNGDQYVWLECTSQDAPFGYQANFTDDRKVLIIKPDGGEIVKTKVYAEIDNKQISKGNYSISESGDLDGQISISSEGAQYYFKYRLESKSPVEKETFYKEYWNSINNLKIHTAVFANDREQIIFTENIAINALNYASLVSDKMIFILDVFNQNNQNNKRIRNRKTPFEIDRGSYDEDEITITLPSGFSVESLPKNTDFQTKYGSYKTTFIQKDATTLIYKRAFLVNEGKYLSSEYEDYRLFNEQVSRNDNAKIVLIKK